MNIKLLKIRKFERYLFAGALTVLMFLSAQFTGHKEIIFPEILAILTGAWIANRQPWNTDKFRIWFLTTLSALIGVILVKFLPLGIYYKVILSFLFTALSLVLFKTTFIPAIPAGIFPIFMNVKTLVYPLAVGIMVLAIVIGQYLLENKHYRHKDKYFPDKINQKMMFKHWAKVFLIFAVISIYPLLQGFLFWLSPPVVVTFAELANPMSPNRKKLFNIWQIMTIGAIIGTVFRLGLNIYSGMPLVICAIFACICMFLVYNKKKILYPPSAGALLMPMILKPDEVIYYPLEVALGLAVLTYFAKVLFNPKSIQKA